MFTHLANIIINYPKRVFSLSIIVLLLAATSMTFIDAEFSGDYGIGDSAESTQVDQRLVNEFGRNDTGILMVFSGPENMAGESSIESVDNAVSHLTETTVIEQVTTPLTSGNSALIAENGGSVLVIADVPDGYMLSATELNYIEHTVRSAAEQSGLVVGFSGPGFIDEDINQRIESSLVRAELVSIPVALVVLLLVFGTLVAAGMPLLAGVASITLAMAAFMAWSSVGFQSSFGINIITMLGLGLGIDYSLFIIKRYRDELKSRTQPEALRVAINTVGKAVFFSGVTVVLGLGGTQFFDMPQLRSLGQAGMIVTISTMFFGLTLLPATLMLLGPRINRGRIGHESRNDNGESAFWSNLATRVMRRPALILVGTIAVLAVMAFPFTDIRQDPGGVDMLPEASEPRQVLEHIGTNFPMASTDPLYVIVDSVDEETVASKVAEMEAIDGVTAVYISQQTDATLVEVISAYDAVDSAHIVEAIRDLSTADTPIQVGGNAAISLDANNLVVDGLLPAILFILASAYIVLLFTFGSVLLPLKAMFMSALSISASVGVVVWAFQWGNLEGVLNFTSNGGTISLVPILVASILFGLSMDYEVLLLSRIQEEYEKTGDNKAAIETGLAHTGQIVTGAAAIMVAVFGGFVLADITMLQSLGFGLAIAVLLDATVVRGILVPSTMSLMGRWNWWAPAWLTRIVDRLGVSHVRSQESATLPVQPTIVPRSAGGGE